MQSTAVLIEPRQPPARAAQRWLALAEAEACRQLATALEQATGSTWRVIRDAERVIIELACASPTVTEGGDLAPGALMLDREGLRLSIGSMDGEEIERVASAAAAIADWMEWADPVVNSSEPGFIERFAHCALHRRDFHRWALMTAQALRERRPEGIQWPRLAQEIEHLGEREARLWFGHLARLLMYLLQWHYLPRRRCREWLVAIHDQRLELADLTARSPSLETRLPSQLEAAYQRARHAAAVAGELAEADLPSQCPWRADQIFDFDFPSAASDRAG
jgi:hypothetical protein